MADGGAAYDAAAARLAAEPMPAADGAGSFTFAAPPTAELDAVTRRGAAANTPRRALELPDGMPLVPGVVVTTVRFGRAEPRRRVL